MYDRNKCDDFFSLEIESSKNARQEDCPSGTLPVTNFLGVEFCPSIFLSHRYIPRQKSGIYWIQVRRAAAAVEISLCMR